MKKGFCIFSLLILLLTPFSISAESWGVWASRPITNNLSSIAQSRYCSTIYPNLDQYDFIAYYTVEHSWLDANTLLYGTATYGGTTWTFEGFAWNDSESSPEEISISRGFSWDDNADYIYKFLDYENYDATNVLNVCDGSQPSITPPSLILPETNPPTITTDNVQSSYIQSISSPSSQGGYVNVLVVDYFNIYSVVQTAETDQFFDSVNDNYYIYQESEGKYIYPVYDRSIMTVYAPNMSVASVPFSVQAVTVGGMSYSFPFASGIIQRDVNKFEYEYVDLETSQSSDFSKLPFSNSSENQNHVEYLGTKAESYLIGTSSSSVNVTINNNGINIHFFFVVTDKYDSIQIATNINNQTIIDNSLQHGNALTQGSKNNLDNANTGLNSTINQFNQLDQQANQDLINDLNAIDLNDFAINGLIQLSNSSNFVRTHFNNLTANNPIGTSVGFALVVGLSLLLLAKRL